MTTSYSTIYFGTPAFAVPPLLSLLEDPRFNVLAVVSQPDRPAGRGNKLTTPPVGEEAKKRGIPLFQPNRVKKEWEELREGLLQIAESFDIGVVCAFGQILPTPCLDFPNKGCINIHASLLPRWRGAAPIQRSIMAGDAETGVSLMQMEAGLDTGPFYSKREIPITSTTTSGELHETLSELGGAMLKDDLEKILLGELTVQPQDETLVTHAAKIEKEEAVIPWEKSARDVLSHIHGISPFPGAFSYYQGKRIKIFSVREVPQLEGRENEPSGTIHRATDSKLEIACGSGVLPIEEAQLEGKKRLPVAEFLKGISFVTGEQLTAHKKAGDNKEDE